MTPAHAISKINCKLILNYLNDSNLSDRPIGISEENGHNANNGIDDNGKNGACGKAPAK